MSAFEQSLNLDNQIKIELAKLGYEILELSRSERYQYAKVRNQIGEHAFFKIALKPEFSPKLQTQIVWSNHFNAHAPLEFRAPRVLDSGTVSGLNYGIFEFITTKPLAIGRTESLTPDSGIVEGRLDQIVRLNNAIEVLPEILLPTSVPIPAEMDQAQQLQFAVRRYIELNRKWYETAVQDRYDLSDLLEELNKFETNLEFGSNHGDFVPWHMIAEGDNLILIDSENASFQKPKYYDFCYCLHRLWTKLERPDLAMAYFEKYVQTVPYALKDDFFDKINTLIASRIIGGFFDAVNDKIEDMKYHEQLLQAFRDGQIFSRTI